MNANASTVNGEFASRTRAGETRPLLYEVTGQGEPIVLLPGTLTGWASWVAHAERLSTARQVVRVQLRNVEMAETGERIPQDYGIATEVAALEATVDLLGLDRFDLAGWSLGGLVSLAFTMRFPQRVRTLTLIEPAAMWVLASSGHTGGWIEEMEKSDRELAGKEITIADLKAFLIRAGIGSESTDIEAHPRWPLMARNRQALSSVGAVWDYADSIEGLASLETPILVVMGTDSADADRLIAQTIARTARHATLLELPGDHACHIEHMDEFLAALDRHLGVSGN